MTLSSGTAAGTVREYLAGTVDKDKNLRYLCASHRKFSNYLLAYLPCRKFLSTLSNSRHVQTFSLIIIIKKIKSQVQVKLALGNIESLCVFFHVEPNRVIFFRLIQHDLKIVFPFFFFGCIFFPSFLQVGDFLVTINLTPQNIFGFKLLLIGQC